MTETGLSPFVQDEPARGDARPVVVARGLTKRYGAITALDGVSFQIFGGIVGLLGANGAGKSTLIRVLLGLLPFEAGEVRLLDLDIRHQGRLARSRTGYMPEHDCLPDDTTAAEFVGHMGELQGLPPREARIRAADVLRYVGLAEERYRPIGGYSTGMKQRTKLATALVHDPRLLLLDEPTNGLDPGGREQMLDVIERTGRVQGLCIVMSTHLLADVEQVADQIIVLDEGHLQRAGSIVSVQVEQPLVRVDVGATGIAPFVAGLERCSLPARRDGGQVLVEVRDEQGLDAIRDLAAELDLPLVRMQRITGSLAGLFAPPEAAAGREEEA